MSAYTLAVRGCQHLGYQPTRMRLNPTTRWNQRVVDGHIAHDLTMQSILDAGVDGIIDGGDVMHWNRPLPRDIEVANRVDDRRVRAGVWAIGNSGNHDAGGGSDLSAMGVMHRPDVGFQAVYPDPSRGPGDGVGPHPGLYEIHDQSSNPALPAGLALHLVSHYGLAASLHDAGIHIDPTPVPGMVNLLFSHAVLATDERLYQCIDPHGEERPIPGEWVTRGWDAVVLSHYHSMGPVPGYPTSGPGQVWYTGSSLRRGFSDEPGERGWVKVTVHDGGRVDVTAQTIWQRPQHDLPVIDATGCSVADLDDLITGHLHDLPLTDPQSASLTGDGGAILRQVITGATPAQRAGLHALAGRYATLTQDAAWWDIAYVANASPGVLRGDGTTRAITARVTDFAREVRVRAEALTRAVAVPPSLTDDVLRQAEHWAEEVHVSADTVEADTTAARGAA